MIDAPSSAAGRGRVVVACGGYRSGSTLQYNLAGELVERANRGRRIGYLNPKDVVALAERWSIVDALGLAVAKGHEVAPGQRDYRGLDEAWRTVWERGLIVPLYTVRDWRDVAASMARKFSYAPAALFASLEWRENLAHMERWLGMGALVQRYERLLADPAGAASALGALLGVETGTAVAHEAARAAGLERQRELASSLPEGAVDPRTLVHWDHIARPEGGAWRDWTPREQELARAELAPLMERFGYAWTP